MALMTLQMDFKGKQRTRILVFLVCILTALLLQTFDARCIHLWLILYNTDFLLHSIIV